MAKLFSNPTKVLVTPISPTAPPSGTYSTSFDLTESVLRENGRWSGPRAAGFTPVRTANGNAFGTNGITNSYDDSYVYLSGFSSNHEIEGVIHKAPNLPNINHEVELHLRMSDDSTNVRSYEILFNFQGNFQVMKWNGPMGGGYFSEITGSGSMPRAPVDGDVVKARVTGTSSAIITAYLNNSVIWTGTDNNNAHLTGNPGIAFFYRPGANQSGYGFKSITARNI